MATIIWISCIVLICIIIGCISAANSHSVADKVNSWIIICIFLVFVLFFAFLWDNAIKSAEVVGIDKEVIYEVEKKTGYSYFKVVDYLTISVENGMELDEAIHNMAPSLSDKEIEKIITQ